MFMHVVDVWLFAFPSAVRPIRLLVREIEDQSSPGPQDTEPFRQHAGRVVEILAHVRVLVEQQVVFENEMLARNPLELFVVAPLFMFLVKHRFPKAKASQRERHSVYWTNLAILGLATGLSWIFGLKAYLLIQLMVMGVAGSAGVWLFYVQHQFEGVYWERAKEWDYTAAALQGSSFYKLPKVLQWFSGNIGFHHIHHLSPRIPNYHLEKCHKAEPLFQNVKTVTLFSSFKSLTFRLWDEQRRKLVGYGCLRTSRREHHCR